MSFKSAFTLALATALWLGGCATQAPRAPTATTVPEFGERLAVPALPEPPGVDVPRPPEELEVVRTPGWREIGRGRASWYGKPFHGRRTASGEVFNMNDLTAAHRTLPFGTRLRVLNPATGQEVVVRINDRGPFTRGRVIDLSRAAAASLGLIRAGVATVVLLEP